MSGANFSEKFNFPSVSNQPCPEKSPEHAASHRIRIRRGGGRAGGRMLGKTDRWFTSFCFSPAFPSKTGSSPGVQFCHRRRRRRRSGLDSPVADRALPMGSLASVRAGKGDDFPTKLFLQLQSAGKIGFTYVVFFCCSLYFYFSCSSERECWNWKVEQVNVF